MNIPFVPPADWTLSMVNAATGFAIGVSLQELQACGMPRTPDATKAVVVALRTMADVIEKYGDSAITEGTIPAVTEDFKLFDAFHCQDVGIVLDTPKES